MSRKRTERLVNVVIALASTRRALTKVQLRETIADYAQTETVEAFERMFERDKSELRDLGVPLRTIPMVTGFDDDVGYYIDHNEYELPNIDVTPEEVTVLALAAKVWNNAALSTAATRAMTKLAALGVGVNHETASAIHTQVRTPDSSFEPLTRAAQTSTRAQFTYQRPDGSDPSKRTIEPWSVVSRRGKWFVIGFDLSRQEPRVFRLARITSKVKLIGEPGDFSPPTSFDTEALITGALKATPQRTARLRVTPGKALALRQQFGIALDVSDIEVSFDDTSPFAAQLCAYGGDVSVLEPDDLRDAVAARWNAVVDAHG